jgi:hypothetical protein
MLHVTITDLDTNEVLVDADTGAIIASIDEGDRIHGLAHIQCDENDFIGVVATARVKIDEVLEGESAEVMAAVEYARAVYKSEV